jgi:predicted ATPase
MLSALERRGRAIGEEARERVIARGVEQERAALPDVEVEAASDGILLSAPGLVRRWLDDARLRWIGSLFR